MKTRNGFLGLIFIILGALLIFDHYHFIHFSIWELWPLIILYMGIQAERKYFNGRGGSKNLLTGATLITYSLIFMISNFASWNYSSRIWPLYIMGPGLGFLQMYYYGHSRKYNFKMGIILVITSSIFLIDTILNIPFDMALYIGLVLFGLYLITKDREDDDFDEAYDETFDEHCDKQYSDDATSSKYSKNTCHSDRLKK
ncbi:LiaI-LiaF-like domain-containing protein [Fusibacter ferrireducens]|uniref:DUF5668 domain-containing protein n=1 Tax=Fusibacter ferrireducens TaxID=2785058 RepID=A0ABR9ZQR6_9FIRM|nr:DUF5668 domain-containing protein [Fusibacter ferrireducens]MBF4692800.1 hypothetical protein [Fusibacter ferrireducens]